MGYRTILSSPMTLTIKNTSGNRVVVSGANLGPGKKRRVAGQVFVNDKYRASELAVLMGKGAIQVNLDGNGWVDYSMTPAEVLALAGNVAPKPVRMYATAALPANADVPVGHVAYDTTLATLVTNDGSAWV